MPAGHRVEAAGPSQSVAPARCEPLGVPVVVMGEAVVSFATDGEVKVVETPALFVTTISYS